MNLSETADLLTAMSAYDRRTIGDGDVIAWQAILPDAAFKDCLEAVKRHYAENTEWMMPAHVRRLVRDIHGERQAMARATGWAPGQAGVPKDQPLPEVADRSTPKWLTDAVREVTSTAGTEILAAIRRNLPEGSREALMPRRVAWEREHKAFLRTHNAEPNPHYRPSVLPDPLVCEACGERLTPHGFHSATGHTRCSEPA